MGRGNVEPVHCEWTDLSIVNGCLLHWGGH